MKSGIELVAIERQEQIEKHGRTIKMDAYENQKEQLRKGAIALLQNSHTGFHCDWDEAICKKMIGKSYLERMIIAAALIVAEIDRLQFKATGGKND